MGGDRDAGESHGQPVKGSGETRFRVSPEMVEAGGVEPPSEATVRRGSPRSVRTFYLVAALPGPNNQARQPTRNVSGLTFGWRVLAPAWFSQQGGGALQTGSPCPARG